METGALRGYRMCPRPQGSKAVELRAWTQVAWRECLFSLLCVRGLTSRRLEVSGRASPSLVHWSLRRAGCHRITSDFSFWLWDPCCFWSPDISTSFLSTRKYLKFLIVLVAQAALTKYHRLGSLNTGVNVSQSWRLGSPQLRCKLLDSLFRIASILSSFNLFKRTT